MPDTSARVPVPLGSYVLVEPVAAKEKTTQGGLVIYTESQASKKIFKGKVLAVGKGRTRDSQGREPIALLTNDIVTYPEFAGYDYEGYKFIPEWEILGIVDRE